MPIEEKKCSKCKGPGPFGKQKTSKDGLHSWCKRCMADATRERRLANPKKAKEEARRWEQNNKDKRRKNRRDSYHRNPEKGRAHAKKYREENPKKVAATKRVYRLKTLEKYMWRRAQKRAADKGWEFNIEIEDIVIPEQCPLLGIVLNKEASNTSKANAPSLDRIDPRLGYIKGNIWVVSLKANTIKSNATLEELELLVKNLRALR